MPYDTAAEPVFSTGLSTHPEATFIHALNKWDERGNRPVSPQISIVRPAVSIAPHAQQHERQKLRAFDQRGNLNELIGPVQVPAANPQRVQRGKPDILKHVAITHAAGPCEGQRLTEILSRAARQIGKAFDFGVDRLRGPVPVPMNDNATAIAPLSLWERDRI